MRHEADVLVIGGGACGIAAALCAAEHGASVCLLEQNPRVGRRLALADALLAHDATGPDSFHGRFARFAQDALRAWPAEKLAAWFEERGLDLQHQDGAWRAKGLTGPALAERLAQGLEGSAVRVFCVAEARELDHSASGFEARGASNLRWAARHVVLATGGVHFRGLGSGARGLGIARVLGHTVETTYPALVGLQTRERWPRNLPGLWMETRLTLLIDGEPAAESEGLILFSQAGIAGPAIYTLSREVQPALDDGRRVELAVNFFPGHDREFVQRWYLSALGEQTRVRTPRALDRLLPERLAAELCEFVGIRGDWRVERLEARERDDLFEMLLNTRLTITDTLGPDAAFGTRGGVNLREVKPRTFESTKVPGLFLAGEMLDLDAREPSPMRHFAFASGLVAGASAANL